MTKTLRNCLAEFIGTFIFVFAGTAVASLHAFLDYGDAGWLAMAAAFGGTLAVLTLAIGPRTGCHLNPALTIASGLAGHTPPSLVTGYVVAQLAGAFAASAALWTLLSSVPGYELGLYGLGANTNPHDMPTTALLLFEAILTAAFVLIVLVVRRDADATLVPALAAGGFYAVAVLIGAPLGAGSLNPARSIAPAVFTSGEPLALVWVYVAGSTTGAVLAVVLHKFVFSNKISVD